MGDARRDSVAVGPTPSGTPVPKRGAQGPSDPGPRSGPTPGRRCHPGGAEGRLFYAGEAGLRAQADRQLLLALG